MTIPTGTTKEDVYVRRAIIVERLYPLIGTSVPCRAFGKRKVNFVFSSIDETATHAARTYKSTLAALKIVEALKNAAIIDTTNPHSHKQKKMGFDRIHILSSRLPRVGMVKIVVGERKNEKIIHYCITKLEQ